MNVKKLLPFVGIAILIIILTNIDYDQIIVEFSNITPFYSFLSLFSVIPLVLLSNYQWQLILKKHKINVSYLYSLKNIFIGYFYGFITPGGYGGYARILYLRDKSNSPLEKCLSNVIIFNTIDYISLLLLGVFGGLILSIRFPNLFNIFIIIVTILIIIIFLFLSFLKKGIGTNLLNKILQTRFFNNYKNNIDRSIEYFYKDLPAPKDLILPLSLSLLGWILRFFELFLISKLFYINIDILYFIPIIAIGNIVASIPITIYGLGTREITLISLFSIFNISAEKIVSLSLFWFTIIWLLPSIIGAIITIKEGSIKKNINFYELDNSQTN